MKPFLEKIAEVFVANEFNKLVDYCFVFPNRRSSAFFRGYLMNKCGGKVLISPKITTISDFISEQVQLCEAGRITLLIRLYLTYKSLSEEHNNEPVAFDRFLFWGDMMINDFNDIDRYLVDADELFKNVKNINDLQTDYLTEEQRYVIKQYWGVDRPKRQEDSLFVQSSYFTLWNSMANIYHRFGDDLVADGLTYSGKSYRIAAEKISVSGTDDFDFSKIVFVGFSTLSNAELKIFRKFKNLGIADFYWDFESPFFDDDNRASYFLKQYIAEFPPHYDIIEKENAHHRPEINIISVPSGAGQAHVVRQLLEQLQQSGQCNAKNSIDTAIVLPEEKYMNAVLGSVPEQFESLNITMGISVRQSPIASLIDTITLAEKRKRNVNGEPAYFYDDIELLASHPYIKRLSGEEPSKLVKLIKKGGLFFVEAKMIADRFPKFAYALNIEEIDYGVFLNRLFDIVYKMLGDASTTRMDRYFIGLYVQSLAQIEDQLQHKNIKINRESLSFLLSKSMSTAKIPFEGRPLKGLQIMGVLETRLLDFKNLIILSMNERIFPTKHYTRSFIPHSIRTAYGLSTTKHQDSMYSYYFYRMISRADNVYLLYDSRVKGLSSGEESRYITQLEQIYNKGRNHHKSLEYSVSISMPEEISVQKNARIVSLLDAYRNENEEYAPKYLSASTINKYLNCPLQFYLEKIEGYAEENEITDFVDSATFGTILHSVMEMVYKPKINQLVDVSYLDSLLRKPASVELQKYITRAINKEYKKYDESRLDAQLDGASLIIGQTIEYYVRGALKYDRRLCSRLLTILDVEKELKFNWDLGEGLRFNFKGFTDRIDSVAGRLRIVDYKTGGDEAKISNSNTLDDLFDMQKENRHHAVLQLLLYCNAYCASIGSKMEITPVLYLLRHIQEYQNGEFVIRNGKKEVYNFLTDIDNDLFMSKVRDVIREIFDPEVPFYQTKQVKNCTYCQFVKLCSR